MTVASLNARLLARKGDARPAPIEGSESRARPAPAGPAPAPGTGPTALPGDPPAGDPRSRARVSLRLDDARHRRLRLAAIHLDASLQQVLTAALDHYLAQVTPDCPCMDSHGAASDGQACANRRRPGGGTA